MKKQIQSQCLLISVLASFSFSAQAEVQGETRVFLSPQGVQEKCIALAKLPGGHYSKKDLEKEQEFCSLDFYNNSVALCAKTWSTSPGTIVYDNSKAGKSSLETEKAHCGSKENGLSSVAKYKQTMNAATTSGTFSTSSLLYYHLSRLLNTTVNVPTAVYRTMDKDEHYERVSSKAKPSANAKMNYSAWQILKQAELKPTSYGTFAIDVFTEDYKQIKGVLLKDKGERYGVEINGTRASGWGTGQNYDFQKTPAFLALQSKLPIEQAFNEGSQLAFKDPAMARAFVVDKSTKLGRPSNLQMAVWMKEVSEIAILDYLFNQQDRIGNIDFQWVWIYRDEAGKIKTEKADSDAPRTKMNQIPVPKEIAAFNPILIQKTFLNDNDAGGMARYLNYAKTTGMLDGLPDSPRAKESAAQFEERMEHAKTHSPLRHLNIDTYRGVVKLAKDFRERGPIYQQMQLSFDTNANQFNIDRFKDLDVNIQNVARIFQTLCEKRTLRFDIPDLAKAATGDFSEVQVGDCRNP